MNPWADLWRRKARAQRERIRFLEWELDWHEWNERMRAGADVASREPMRPSELMALLEANDEIADWVADLEPWQVAFLLRLSEDESL